jgi:hypothetical protein
VRFAVSHSDLHHTRFIYQNPSQRFPTDPPQIAQLRDPVMTFERCALSAHSLASSVAAGAALTIAFYAEIRAKTASRPDILFEEVFGKNEEPL